MRFKSCVILLSLLFFSAVGFAQKDSVPKRSKLVIEQSVHNFGSVGQGTLVKHSFQLKNAGDAELNLQRIVPACGCTATSSSRDIIPPGGEATLDVEFDTTGFSGDKVKIVRVYTNDPDNLSSVVTLKGRVEPDVLVEPVKVNFGKVVSSSLSDGKTKEITVQAREGSEVKLGDVHSRSKHLEMTLLESTPQKKRFKLKVLPDVPIGQLRDRVVVTVSGSKQKSVHIPVFANVTGPVDINPSAVSFGVLEGASTISRSVRLENRGQSPLKILSLKSQHPAITIDKKTITPGRVYVLKVSVDPSKVVRDLRSSFEIETDEPEDAEPYRVSVYGILPPKL